MGVDLALWHGLARLGLERSLYEKATMFDIYSLVMSCLNFCNIANLIASAGKSNEHVTLSLNFFVSD